MTPERNDEFDLAQLDSAEFLLFQDLINGAIRRSIKSFIPLVARASGGSIPIWIAHPEISEKLLKGLMDHWNDIRQWILFLHQEIIIQTNVDFDLRLDCKKSVLEFLGLVRDRLVMPWSQLITTDLEMMWLICDLWYLETKDSRFFTWSSDGTNQRESAVLNSCFLIAHEVRITLDWANILHSFHNDTELLASAALGHLDREISQGTLDLNCIGWDTHIISALSFRENIRLALLRQGAIKAAADVLALIVSKHWSADKRVVAARCMVNAATFLRVRLDDLDGIPFILQALDSALIPSLLKCEPLLPFADNPAGSHQPAIVLGDLLPSYTVYRSVVRPLSFIIDDVEKTRADAKVIKGGQLHEAWMRLKQAVAERRKFMKHDIAEGHHIQTCQNDKCGRAGETGTFKRCGGCLHAFYCSKACQRYDWGYGKHRFYCKMVHQRCDRTKGQVSAVCTKDLRFLDQVIISELRKHRDRIREHDLKINVIELNFLGGSVGITFDSKRVDPNPFKLKCACEKFANARWNKMIGKARDATESLVLVRAFIPGGMSRKIILQAIPLKRILEGEHNHGYYRWADRIEPDINLIYTCCGQESVKKDPEGLRG
ncbi:hypothetical protein BU15DRAFT_61528 [Melanogaster broomeanus]|nr:hypothetical protein BU15DRAFT_61528 [Melanogaster broomeanus]